MKKLIIIASVIALVGPTAAFAGSENSAKPLSAAKEFKCWSYIPFPGNLPGEFMRPCIAAD